MTRRECPEDSANSYKKYNYNLIIYNYMKNGSATSRAITFKVLTVAQLVTKCIITLISYRIRKNQTIKAILSQLNPF
jgi:hypothetical protein